MSTSVALAPSMRAAADAAAAPVFCESDRGEWGGICPDCGRPLPPLPGPLQSWHASRVNDPELSVQARERGSALRHWHL